MAQGFEGIREGGCFYVNKTGFVRDWWLAQDDVMLVCHPRRLGKTLNLDTARCFLSRDFSGRGVYAKRTPFRFRTRASV